MYTIPVRAPLSLSSMATPVLPTRSTPSVSTMVEIRTAFLEPASTTSCLTLVGLCRYNLSFAAPRDFHCACCCFKKTLHFISAEMVDVTGPVTAGVSSTGEFGGLGSWKEGTARKPATPSWPEGSHVRGWGACKLLDEPKPLLLFVSGGPPGKEGNGGGAGGCSC